MKENDNIKIKKINVCDGNKDDNAKYYPEEPKKIESGIDELFLKVIIEKIDILAEMEVINKRMRSAAIKDTTTEKEAKAYDIGVKNTMYALESLITHSEGEKDRLIYQKHGEQSDVVQYRTFEQVLKDMEENGVLELSN